MSAYSNPSNLIIVVIMILMIVMYIDMNINNVECLDPHVNISEEDTSKDILNGIETDMAGEVDDQINRTDPRNMQIITAGLGPEIRRLGELESTLNNVQINQIRNSNVIDKLYKRDVMGDYKTRGWFVQVHDVISTPHGITLGAELTKFHGIRRICFRAHQNFGFVGVPQDPYFLPKTEFVGFRAMTIFKIPKTGYYDFKVLSDDGSRLMYQVVDSDVMLNEKNIRSLWKPLIDSWRFQAETWKHTPKLYFNQSDLVLLRFDHFQADGNSGACIKVRYSQVEDDFTNNDNNRLQDNFDDFNYADLHCSLLWSHVPLMGRT
jgi:PA14 domain-containing protein